MIDRDCEYDAKLDEPMIAESWDAKGEASEVPAYRKTNGITTCCTFFFILQESFHVLLHIWGLTGGLKAAGRKPPTIVWPLRIYHSLDLFSGVASYVHLRKLGATGGIAYQVAFISYLFVHLDFRGEERSNFICQIIRIRM